MDIQEYISSGILEAYALDTLLAEERVEVEDLLSQYPELRLELTEIEKGLEAVAFETAVEPNKELKSSLLNALDTKELQKDEFPQKGDALGLEEEDNIVSMNRGSSVWSYVAAAAIALALVSSFAAYNFYSRWKAAESLYTALLDDSELLAKEYNQVNERLDDLSRDLDVISNAQFQRVNLASVVEGESFTASVYWSESSQEAYLNIIELKELAENQQYQLWAIFDGQLVDMGVFDFDKAGLMKMKSVESPETFAVTIEPRGGSVDPTLDAIQVAGNVG